MVLGQQISAGRNPKDRKRRSKWRAEIREAGQRRVPCGNNGRIQPPVKSNAIPAQTGIAVFVVLRRNEISRNCAFRERLKAMRKTFRNVKCMMILRTQHFCMASTERRRFFSQINDHIQNGSLRAIQDFGMLVWRQLKMHSADHVFV